jgi:hypothetical protein
MPDVAEGAVLHPGAHVTTAAKTMAASGRIGASSFVYVTPKD